MSKKIKIQIEHSFELNFPFEEYISIMLDIVPKNDLAGIAKIRILDRSRQPKETDNIEGSYYASGNGKKAIIELYLEPFLKTKKNFNLFAAYPELSALMFVRVLFHEIGHHVDKFKRHNIKNHEDFAEKYAGAGMIRFLETRYEKIFPELEKINRDTRIKTADRELLSDHQKEFLKIFHDQTETMDFP